MKFWIGSIIVLGVLNAEECGMHIEKVLNEKTTYTLIVTHDKECEIIMDENRSKIVLISKTVDENITKLNMSRTHTTAIENLIRLAKSKLGVRYKYAAKGPDYFDCSGFVYYLFKESKISIPRSSLAQSKSGDKLSREQIEKGDILFFDTHERGHINHSGVYLGDGKFIHSSSGKAYGVTISELDKGFYKDKFRWGVRKLTE